MRAPPEIAAAAQQLAPARRYWAIVGNGTNRIAANEVRIKLSELCYKSIACDSTEDKKHIDLSSEPLILVCAAGLTGSTADDVAKEVAIYRAHKAAPIVIASEGEERFSAALQAISVPPTHPPLAFVLSAMAGHLFGYEAALAIDAQARPLREARAAIESPCRRSAAASVADGDQLLRRAARRRSSRSPPGSSTACAPASTTATSRQHGGAARVAASATRSASRRSTSYQVEYGKVGTPSVVVEDLTAALTRAIEELTRPVDAIKHQAKTVTVGISRSRRDAAAGAARAGGARHRRARDSLSYRTLRTLADLDPSVDEVLGCTRYRIEGDVSTDDDDARRRSSTAAASRRELPSPHRARPRAAGHQAPGRDRARAPGGPRPQRRPHAC